MCLTQRAQMDKKKISLIIVGLLCISVISLVSRELVSREKRKITYHVSQDDYEPLKTLTDVKTLVESTWELPENELTIKSSLKTEEQIDTTYWSLHYYDGEDYILKVKIDADTGRIVSLTDHRNNGIINQVTNEDQVLTIATNLCDKMGVDVSKLAEPAIYTPHTAGDKIFNEYTVIYYQYYKGLRVLGGYIKTRINAESLKPVGYTNALVEIQEINIVSKTSKSDARKAANEYLQSSIIKDKGYGTCTIQSVELCVGQVHYHPYEDRVIVPKGEPQLLWFVLAKSQNSRQIGVMIDAVDCTVIGIEESK